MGSPKVSLPTLMTLNTYRISANNCSYNYSFLRLMVLQLFKGDNYTREETIVFLGFLSTHNLNCCRNVQFEINLKSHFDSLVIVKDTYLTGKLV